MKKVLCFLCLLFLLLTNINIVKAEGDCGDVTFRSNGTGSPSGVYFGRYQIFNYYVSVNGKSNPAICHNPGVHSWDSSGESLQCIRVVGDPTSSVRTQSIYDAGIVDILKNAPSSAQWLAINVYQLLFPSQVDVRYANAELHSSQIFYFEYQVNRLLEENSSSAKSLQEKVNELRRYAGSSVGSKYNVSSSYSNANGEKGKVDGVLSYVLSALDAAIDYAKNGGTKIDINRNPKKERIQTETEITNRLTYTFKVQNFSEDGEIYLNYTCTSGCQYVATTNFYLNGNLVSDIGSINLRTLLTQEGDNFSGTIEFKMEFIGPIVEEDEECTETTYKLELKYKDKRLDEYAYEVSTGSNVGTNQRLYVLGNNSSDFRITNLEGSFKMCTTKLEADDCKTFITNVSCESCKEDKNEVEIKEGYDTSDVCQSPTDEELDIKKCVANDDAKDTAGNTHKRTDLTEEAGEENFEEGGIFCKEDYKLILPGSRKVDSGSYFVLKSKLEGTQSCYSSKIKDNDETIANVEAAARNTIDTYKKYAEAKALLECLNGEGGSGCRVFAFYRGGGVCRTKMVTSQKYAAPDAKGNCPSGYRDTGMDVPKPCVQSYQEPENFYYWIPGLYVYWDYTYYDANSCSKVPGNGYLDWTTSDQSLWFCPEDDEEEMDFEKGKQEAANDLIPELKDTLGKESTIKVTLVSDDGKGNPTYNVSGSGATGFTGGLGTGGMLSILKNYNKVVGFYTGGASVGGGSITDGDDGYTGSGEGSYGVMVNPNPFGGWQMNYNFDPEMHFWYPEIYMKDFKNDLLIRSDEEIEREPAEYCIGDVSKDYKECYGDGGWKESLSLGAIGDKNADIYQGEACACTLDGCKKYTYAVSNVKYIKQSQKAKAKFVTPTQFYNFYPSGKIGVADPGEDFENAEELTNGLPVALNSENGTKDYLLWYEKLGEFYDADRLGRIWGAYNSVMATTLSAQTNEACGENPSLKYDYTYEGEYFDEGLYVCKYDVNICSDDKTEACSPEKDGKCDASCPNDPDCFCPTCPPDVENSCSIMLDESGNKHYIGKRGSEVSQGTYESQCCPSGNCGVYCETCLYNGQELQVDYRQITNEDVNPTKRTLGRNWNWDDSIDSAIELKAYVTTKEIEENGNEIFDIDFSKVSNNNNNASDDFAMQVKMDMRTMSWIRDYNRSHNGYLDSELDCYDLEFEGKTYKNIYCYSKFIDDILASEVSSNIKITGADRPSEALRETSSDKYFTSWATAGQSSSGWGVSDAISMQYTTHFGKEFDDETGIATDYHVGPSWK